jgi:hypothetical protein
LISPSDAPHFWKKQFPQGFHSSWGWPTPRKPFKKDPVSSQNPWLFGRRDGVTKAQTGRLPSDRSRPSQHSRRQEKEGSQKRQNAVHGDSSNAKRQENQPNDGINDERKQGKRPTEAKQDAPEYEGNHGNPLTSYYARARVEVPSFVKAFSLSLRAIDTGTSASSSI